MSGEGIAFLAMSGRRIGLIVAAVAALVLVYAWIDGGEEALHPIVQPIDVPEYRQ